MLKQIATDRQKNFLLLLYKNKNLKLWTLFCYSLLKAKEAERMAGQNKWMPAEPTPPKEPAPPANPVKQVKLNLKKILIFIFMGLLTKLLLWRIFYQLYLKLW